jgi:hypothetical protein
MEEIRWKTAFLYTPLPIYTTNVTPWNSHTLTFCSTYKFLLDFLSHQSLPVSFAICINLVHLDGQMPSASLWNKHTIPHLCPQFVVISLSASFCSSKSKLIFSTYILSLLQILLLSILATIFAIFATKLNFVAFGFFLQKFILTLGHCPISCMLLISPVTILRPLSPLRFAKYKVFIFCIYFVFMFDVWFSGPFDRSQISVI